MGPKPSVPPPGLPPYEAAEPTRMAMGDTLRFAQKVKLLQLVPSGELSSTGYALARPGQEYLVLLPSNEQRSFTVALAAGTYAVEWYGVDTRRTMQAASVTLKRPVPIAFDAPMAPAVLYLKRTGH